MLGSFLLSLYRIVQDPLGPSLMAQFGLVGHSLSDHLRPCHSN